MGKKRSRQPEMFVAAAGMRPPGHRFYEKLNELLDLADFDRQVEALCEPFYDPDPTKGRQSIPPGVYFRMLLIGYFEGIESERGICWRCEDSLSLREFLNLNLDDPVPDHSTLSRTRTRLSSDVFQAVFRLVLKLVEEKGLLRGRVAGVDSTYLRADASMKAIVRRDTQESYDAYILQLAKAAGIENPTAEDARRHDRKRKKKTSNEEWGSPTDPDARIARLKDGRTRLSYKAEHVTDLETGAIIAATVHPSDAPDTETLLPSLETARQNVLSESETQTAETKNGSDRNDDDDDQPGGNGEVGPRGAVEVVADKGYYKTQLLVDLKEAGFRPYIPEPVRQHRRRLAELDPEARRAVLDNRRRTTRVKGKSHQRKRGELLERPFAHLLETGAARRTRLRGRGNVEKRYIIHAAAANLGLILRTTHGRGTPRGWADGGLLGLLLALLCSVAEVALGPVYRAVGRLMTQLLAPVTQLPGLQNCRLGPKSTGC